MTERDLKRALAFLAGGPAELAPASGDGKLLLDAGGRGAIGVAADAVRQLVKNGLATCDGSTVRLTPEGAMRRRRDEAPADGFLVQHRTIEAQRIMLPEGPGVAQVNLDESPLAALARRRDRDGRPLLSPGEVAAGDRLRSDYARGQIMPRLSANWQASVSSGRRDGGISDLTDAALAARIRVDRALDAVGPELTGVLVDVCCFLKGLETVERERGWPARSARLLLRTALAALARHYVPPVRQRRQRALHWGAEGYRPSIAGGETA